MTSVVSVSRQQARRDFLVVVLALHSGCTDAVGFVALGGAFTSVMTGNLVLVGIASSRADSALLWKVSCAVVAYILGCAVGARVAGLPAASDGVWPTAVSKVLRIQLFLTFLFAALWWATEPSRSSGSQLGLLAINALCLGLQSSAVQRFGVAGLSTTYLTGTLTSLVVRLATGGRVRDVGLSARLLAGLVAGALVGAWLARDAQPVVPILLLADLLVVLLVSARHRA